VMEKETKAIEEFKSAIAKIDKKMVEVDPSAFDDINKLDQERTFVQESLDETENNWLENLESVEELRQQLVDMGHQIK